MRILFMGTPDIAAECLKALYAAGHDICAVYTRRDKPVGRKQVLTAPPVKEVALAHGTPVFQPRTLRDGSEDENIRALAPELIIRDGAPFAHSNRKATQISAIVTATAAAQQSGHRYCRCHRSRGL